MKKHHAPEFVIAWNEHPDDGCAHFVTVVGMAAIKLCDGKRLAPWEWFADPRTEVDCVECLLGAARSMRLGK